MQQLIDSPTNTSTVSARSRKRLCAAFLAISSLLGTSLASADSIKVAFTADQGVGEGARAVLSLIANEGTDLLLIQGDLGYEEDTAEQWEANLDNILGHHFPVLTVAGNHDDDEWPRYRKYIQRRVDRVGALSCSGTPGVKSLCRFGNIEIAQASPGIRNADGIDPYDDYAGYIRSAFSGQTGRWRICSWHKNQRDLQTGDKSDGTGWDIYDACLDAGAMVAVAHQHSYSRTYLLSNFEHQTVAHRSSHMKLEPGRSFVFVSGLGGYSIRPQTRGGDWWASIYTASQGATHGALFCTFETSTADCYFKAIDGSVPDRFTLELAGGGSGNVSPPAPQPVQPTFQPAQDLPEGNGYVFARTDKDEYRWVGRNASGAMGNVWIDKSCAKQLGGATFWGDWDDLMDQASQTDTIAYPCNGQEQNATLLASGSGYVFARNDKNEYRWIAPDGYGGVGNTWIDKRCAESFGGPSEWGDWDDLLALAPNVDSIANPCAAAQDEGGYVFARTDRQEYRWIERDRNTGMLGSAWIDKQCADSLGGPAVSGDWDALMELAPAFDAIENPCP